LHPPFLEKRALIWKNNPFILGLGNNNLIMTRTHYNVPEEPVQPVISGIWPGGMGEACLQGTVAKLLPAYNCHIPADIHMQIPAAVNPA